MEFYNIIMIRVYSDLTNIGYYSIIHPNNCITFLPIIETKKMKKIPLFLDPSRIVDKCKNVPLINYYQYSKYNVKAIHYDPRIDLGFYTEELRPSRLPRKIDRDFIILFMAGLAEYPENIWSFKNQSIHKIIQELKNIGKIGIYLVGGLIVEKTIIIQDNEWDENIEKYPVLIYSPHYYRLEPKDRETYAVLGKGFYIKPPIKIAKLTNIGFKVTRALIRLIGKKNAENLLKQNFRKTRILRVSREKFSEIISPYMEII